MKIKDVPINTISKKLRSGLTLNTGPFTFQIQSTDKNVCHSFYTLYADFTFIENIPYIDFIISVCSPNNIRKWIYPKVDFSFDGFHPFKPLPKNHSYPLFEWGMNWCIATNAHQFLILHAAVIEKNGVSVVMPAPPGSGKSTLCAALIHNGWRLLSDELTLISLEDDLLYPLVRPVNLKNDSINIIKKFAPSAIFSDSIHDTHKGTVALMKPPIDSVERMALPVNPAYIIFPQYLKESSLTLNELSADATFTQMIANSFNYDVLGLEGFTAMGKLINNTSHYSLQYSSLYDAIELFDNIANKKI